MISFIKFYIWITLMISVILIWRSIFLIDNTHLVKSRMIAIILLCIYITLTIINFDKFETMSAHKRNIFVYIALIIFILSHRLYYYLKK